MWGAASDHRIESLLLEAKSALPLSCSAVSLSERKDRTPARSHVHTDTHCPSTTNVHVVNFDTMTAVVGQDGGEPGKYSFKMYSITLEDYKN